MNERPEDSLNAVLFDARNRLRELQNNLEDEGSSITQIMANIEDLSANLKEDSEKISNLPNTASDLLPLVRTPPKTARKVKQHQYIPPKDEIKINHTKATLLKKKYTNVEKEKAKKLPTLKGNAKYLDASTLIARGIASKTDDLSDVVPAIEPSNASHPPVPLFPNLHIDIAGAAREIQRKKILRERNEARRIKVIPKKEEATPRNVKKVKKEREEEKPKEEPQKPRIYEEIQDEYAYQTLLVVRGKIARETPDFESFQRTNADKWDKLEDILGKIEKICGVYKISYAEIDGRKLSETANMKNVNLMQALSCLIGLDDYISDKMNKAALTIQRNFRLCKENKIINQRKLEFRAALAIQCFWRMKKQKDVFISNLRDRIESVGSRASELSKVLNGSYNEMEKLPYVEVHVITSPQDLMRVFQLMFTNVQLILITHYLPHPHIWEEFLDFMSYCGINNVNERINFITLKEMEGVNGITNRLFLDMRSIQNVKKIVCNRSAFIVPHSDWDIERQVSVDISLPIFGCAEPEFFESRASITEIFQKAGIVTTISTEECTDIAYLGRRAQELMRENKDFKRWIVRLGFSQTEDGIAWFDTNKDLIYSTTSYEVLLKNVLSSTTKPQQFIKQIPERGATIEAVPPIIHSFPSVSLLLTGSEIRVLGTFERMHHSPYRFGALIVPSVSVDSYELISMGKAAASQLMKKGVIGYVCIDFLAFKEESKTRIIGFDIRLNYYPTILNTVFLTLCSGYDESRNQIVSLQTNTHHTKGKNEKLVRFAVVHLGLTHQGFSFVGSNDVKKACFNQGLMFDLLQRTGFNINFLDAPSEGRSFAIASAFTPELALSLFEKSYSFLLKYLSAKVASDDNSTVARALISVRHFKNRVFK